MRAIVWSKAPEVGIPEGPALLADSSHLWVGYETTAEPQGRIHAVVRFDDVIDHRLSPINDEGLGKHPCASAGLKWYAFNEVIGSQESARWRVLNPRHWVVSFKDNTLDVLAKNADVVARAIDADNALGALLSAVVRA
jgi:hypothetical protein